VDPAAVETAVAATTGPIGTALVALFFWLRAERQRVADQLDKLETAIGDLAFRVEDLVVLVTTPDETDKSEPRRFWPPRKEARHVATD